MIARRVSKYDKIPFLFGLNFSLGNNHVATLLHYLPD